MLLVCLDKRASLVDQTQASLVDQTQASLVDQTQATVVLKQRRSHTATLPALAMLIGLDATSTTLQMWLTFISFLTPDTAVTELSGATFRHSLTIAATNLKWTCSKQAADIKPRGSIWTQALTLYNLVSPYLKYGDVQPDVVCVSSQAI